MKEKLSDFILPIGLIVLGYLGLNKLFPETKTSSEVSAACPRGKKYSRGLFGTCDPNYLMDVFDGFFSGGSCVCQGSKPVTDSGSSGSNSSSWDDFLNWLAPSDSNEVAAIQVNQPGKCMKSPLGNIIPVAVGDFVDPNITLFDCPAPPAPPAPQAPLGSISRFGGLTPTVYTPSAPAPSAPIHGSFDTGANPYNGTPVNSVTGGGYAYPGTIGGWGV